MFIRFTKKFCTYGLCVIGYASIYAGLSYACGLVAPWLFPVAALIIILGLFAYFGAKSDISSEKHEKTMAEAHDRHVATMAKLRGLDNV